MPIYELQVGSQSADSGKAGLSRSLANINMELPIEYFFHMPSVS